MPGIRCSAGKAEVYPRLCVSSQVIAGMRVNEELKAAKRLEEIEKERIRLQKVSHSLWLRGAPGCLY